MEGRHHSDSLLAPGWLVTGRGPGDGTDPISEPQATHTTILLCTPGSVLNAWCRWSHLVLMTTLGSGIINLKRKPRAERLNNLPKVTGPTPDSSSDLSERKLVPCLPRLATVPQENMGWTLGILAASLFESGNCRARLVRTGGSVSV